MSNRSSQPCGQVGVGAGARHRTRRRQGPAAGPRGAPDALRMVSHCLRPQGAVVNVCDNHPCYAGGWTGP